MLSILLHVAIRGGGCPKFFLPDRVRQHQTTVLGQPSHLSGSCLQVEPLSRLHERLYCTGTWETYPRLLTKVSPLGDSSNDNQTEHHAVANEASPPRLTLMTHGPGTSTSEVCGLSILQLCSETRLHRYAAAWSSALPQSIGNGSDFQAWPTAMRDSKWHSLAGARRWRLDLRLCRGRQSFRRVPRPQLARVFTTRCTPFASLSSGAWEGLADSICEDDRPVLIRHAPQAAPAALGCAERSSTMH